MLFCNTMSVHKTCHPEHDTDSNYLSTDWFEIYMSLYTLNFMVICQDMGHPCWNVKWSGKKVCRKCSSSKHKFRWSVYRINNIACIHLLLMEFLIEMKNICCFYYCLFLFRGTNFDAKTCSRIVMLLALLEE